MGITPSPEAVEAAAEKVARDEIDDHHKRADDYFGNPKEAGYYVKAYCDTQTASLRKRVEELELMNLDMKIRLSLWSSTIQRYQSWKANNVPDRDYPNAIIADYERLSQFPATKSELLEEIKDVLNGLCGCLKVVAKRDLSETQIEILNALFDRKESLIKRLTPQP